ncbi:MAG: TIGR04282 family arsenosugar biosynthesis glycosyltransferase [Acidobacteriota bacterium]
MAVIRTRLNSALLLFSRYPRLGKVKTRLSPSLSPEACLELHRALLLDTLDRLSQLEVTCHLFLADCSREEIREFAHAHGLPESLHLHLQEGKDLGDRMWRAYQEVAPSVDRVVLLGSDTPSLPLSRIQEALLQLEQSPVVVGPVEDGGYYLLGLAEPRKELFYGIRWGTSAVLEQTLSKLAAGECYLLASWYDIDTESDLCRLQKELSGEGEFEGFPERTFGFLRQKEEST